MISRAGHYLVWFGLGQDPNQIETDRFFKIGTECEPTFKTEPKIRFGSVPFDLVLVSLDLDHKALLLVTTAH